MISHCILSWVIEKSKTDNIVDLSLDFMGINAHNGFGLFSINERLDYLGGRLELISSPGRGCKAVLEVPLG